MILTKTELSGVFAVDMVARRDPRGWFGEAFNFKNDPLQAHQVNFSQSLKAGTFRGLHYQEPNGQTKLVYCVRGQALDLVVDVRPESPTYLECVRFTLGPHEGKGVLVTPGFAHGWLSLEDDSQIVYMVEGLWSLKDEKGLRFDDPAISPSLKSLPISVISDRDKTWPLVTPRPGA